MRVRLHPLGQQQPYVVVHVPSSWEEFTTTALDRLGLDAGANASMTRLRFFLPDGAEVVGLEDLDADDVRNRSILAHAARCIADMCECDHPLIGDRGRPC